MADTVRPTKKQRELLTFIEQFISEHGYSPSYREVMSGLHYTSVATVALHINNLIKRGHLRKRDHSARSLEVVTPSDLPLNPSRPSEEAEERWLVNKVEALFKEAEAAEHVTAQQIDQLFVLAGSLTILGLESAAANFAQRLTVLKEKV